MLDSHLTPFLVESLTDSDKGAEVNFKLAAFSESLSRLAEVHFERAVLQVCLSAALRSVIV